MQTTGEGLGNGRFDQARPWIDEVTLLRKHRGAFSESPTLVEGMGLSILTEVGHPSMAWEAPATGTTWAHRHLATHRQPTNTFPAFNHSTRDFMPRDYRFTAVPRSSRNRFVSTVIAAADPATAHFDQDLSRPGLRIGHRFDANISGTES